MYGSMDIISYSYILIWSVYKKLLFFIPIFIKKSNSFCLYCTYEYHILILYIPYHYIYSLSCLSIPLHHNFQCFANFTFHTFYHTSLHLSYSQQPHSLDVQVPAEAKGWKGEKKETTPASCSSRTHGRGQPALCPPGVWRGHQNVHGSNTAVLPRTRTIPGLTHHPHFLTVCLMHD